MIKIIGLAPTTYEKIDNLLEDWTKRIDEDDGGVYVELADHVGIEYTFGQLTISDGVVATLIDSLEFERVEII